jgi:hypothetical protein
LVVITASTMVEVSGCWAVQSQSCGPIEGLRGAACEPWYARP